jgi:5'-deoxynucleotidase YfbR-like HD superfamily hydrolase
MKTTLNFILNGAEVIRYHTNTTLMRETVGHHSHGVACLVLLFDPDASRELLVAALFHDLSEQKTGDIPSPAKRIYGIGEQVSSLERELMFDAGIGFPNLSSAEARILKLADIAHGALFCVREMSLGNSRMRAIYGTYMTYAHQMNLVDRENVVFNMIEEMANERE